MVNSRDMSDKKNNSAGHSYNNNAYFKYHLVGGIITLFYWLLSSYLLNGHLDPNECIEFPENPGYHVINTGSSSDNEVYGRYRLVYVHIKKPWGTEDTTFDLKNEDIWSGAPVLFIPGHAGSYNQSKTIAAQLHSQLIARENDIVYNNNQGRGSIRVFALDFREDLSAFSGHYLEAQAEFVNNCVKYILKKCNERANVRHAVGPKSVLLIAHSMGGIAARGALFARNFLQGSISTIITLNTPHQAISPLMTGQKMIQYYSWLNKKWYDATSTAAKMEKRNHYDSNKFQTLVVSIAGGRRDTKIRSDLTSLNNIIVGKYNFLHIWSGSMEGVWVENDHDSIMWCGQFIIMLSQTIIDLLDTKNNNGQFYYDKITRYHIIKKGLLGNRLGSKFFDSSPRFIKTFHDDKLSMYNTNSKKKSNEIYMNLRSVKFHGISHCVDDVERKELARTEKVSENKLIMDSVLTLISNVSYNFLLNYMTVSLCVDLDCNACETPLSINEMKSQIQRFPNGLKRVHLHHSYDPRMNFGAKRHVHKWSRASKDSLLDNFEDDDSLGGSLNLLYIPNEYFQNGHQSIRIAIKRADNNYPKTKHQMTKAQAERRSIFISAQYYNKRNDKSYYNNNNNDNDKVLYNDEASYNDNGYFAFFNYLIFGLKNIFIPVNHPMVLDLSSIVRVFNNRFLPQVLVLEKLKCKKEVTSYHETNGNSNHKSYHHESFQPIIRYVFYNGSVLNSNKILKNLEIVEESTASPRPLTYNDNKYRYRINGHYREIDSIVLNLISDPSCSYKVNLEVDMWSVPNSFNRYMVPKWFSLTFIITVLIESVRLYTWRKAGKIPPSFSNIIFNTRYVLYIIVGLTILVNLKLFFTCNINHSENALFKIHSSTDDCKLSTFIYTVTILLSIGNAITGHLLLLLVSKLLQMIVLAYIYVYVWIKGRPPFDGRARKRSRSNSDVEEQKCFADSNGIQKVVNTDSNSKMLYFILRIVSLYTMLCLHPMLLLLLLMLYRYCIEAFVDAEITYTNLTYRPANANHSIVYAMKCIFNLNDETSSMSIMHINNKDYSLEMIVLNNLAFLLTQATTLLLDVRTLFSFYNSSDTPLPFFQSFLLLPGVLVLYYNKRSCYKQHIETWYTSMVCGIGGFLFGLDYLHDAYYVYFVLNIVILIKNECYLFREKA